MQLEIPDGAHVHILIGKAPPLALTDQTGSPRPMTATRSLIRGALVAALLCGSFLVGKQFGPVRTVAAEASTSQSFAPPDSRSAGPGAAPAAVPPEFTQQLQRPPTVLPPPGRTPPGKSPFGLEP